MLPGVDKTQYTQNKDTQEKMYLYINIWDVIETDRKRQMDRQVRQASR